MGGSKWVFLIFTLKAELAGELEHSSTDIVDLVVVIDPSGSVYEGGEEY